MRKIKQIKGITLVALVITIIVLLILAGITINLTIGQDGILKKAEESGENYVNSSNYEKEELAGLTNELDNIIFNATVGDNTSQNTGNSIKVEAVETHTPVTLTYTWEELEQIAEVISDNQSTITSDTSEVQVEIDGTQYIIGVGDKTTLTYSGTAKTVRIMGFNHDTLAEASAYGEEKTNTYAGITFEFVKSIMLTKLNSSDKNSGGWGSTVLRGTLNNTAINNLSNKDYIKKVNKSYIKTYNTASSVTTCQDKLWLLSCSEIWNNGYKSGYYGYSITKEGEQYKYYEDIKATWNVENSKIAKDASALWLRSAYALSSKYFCRVDSDGACFYDDADGKLSIMPGFSI